MKRKPGRPKLGKENKTHCSIRLEPKNKAHIIKTYKSVQAWVDYMVELMDNYDPTPYCMSCWAMTAKKCKCGPIAEND